MGIFSFKMFPRCSLSGTETRYSLFIIKSKSFFFPPELVFIEHYPPNRQAGLLVMPAHCQVLGRAFRQPDIF